MNISIGKLQLGGGGEGDFRVSRHAEICQFDRFSLEINFKRARSCNYGIPRLGFFFFLSAYKNTRDKREKRIYILQVTEAQVINPCW